MPDDDLVETEAAADHPDPVAESRHEREELAGAFIRGWKKALGVVLTAMLLVGLIATSVISAQASRDARDSADAAETAAGAAQVASEAVRNLVDEQIASNDDALCRAVWTAPITEAERAANDASGRLLIALTSQATLALAGVELRPEDLEGSVIAAADIEAADVVANEAIRQRDVLYTAATTDRPLYDRLCDQGPPSFTPPD